MVSLTFLLRIKNHPVQGNQKIKDNWRQLTTLTLNIQSSIASNSIRFTFKVCVLKYLCKECSFFQQECRWLPRLEDCAENSAWLWLSHPHVMQVWGTVLDEVTGNTFYLLDTPIATLDQIQVRKGLQTNFLILFSIENIIAYIVLHIQTL